ncbi:MAG: SPOR domain-containing protein [Deltaproteobacteria bacterium]|nr:SPOR domain-containing protein [Deltaproteobacteria bacterium]
MANRRSAPKKMVRKYTIGLTMKHIIMISLAFLFVLLWIFTLGIIVSRGLLNDAVDNLTAAKQKQTATSGSKETSGEETMPSKSVMPIKEEELTFYKELTEKKEIAKDKTPFEPVENEKQPKPEAPSLAPDKVDKKEGLVTAEEKIKRIRERIQNYNVQVAALKNIDESKDMVKKLINLGYPAYYYQTSVKGESYYRVRCGPFSTLEEAKKHAKRLSDKEGFTPFIIKPTQNN